MSFPLLHYSANLLIMFLRFVARLNSLVNRIVHVEDKQCLTPHAFNISDRRMAEMIFESTSYPVVTANLGNTDHDVSSIDCLSSEITNSILL